MSDFKISVCKKGSKFNVACFDGFDCIRDFIEYDDEISGIQDARLFLFDTKGVIDIEIVRPVITRMTTSIKKVRRSA